MCSAARARRPSPTAASRAARWAGGRSASWSGQPAHHLTLERNPYYFRPGYPKLDRVIIRFLPSGQRGAAPWPCCRGEVQVAGSMRVRLPERSAADDRR